MRIAAMNFCSSHFNAFFFLFEEKCTFLIRFRSLQIKMKCSCRLLNCMCCLCINVHQCALTICNNERSGWKVHWYLFFLDEQRDRVFLCLYLIDVLPLANRSSACRSPRPSERYYETYDDWNWNEIGSIDILKRRQNDVIDCCVKRRESKILSQLQLLLPP